MFIVRHNSLTGLVRNMRGMAAVFVVVAMLAVPLGLISTGAAADTNRDLTPILIGPQRTDRFDGGEVVGVKAGDALFGVRYGTLDHPNDLVIFAEYKRFLGGAEIYDAEGNHLATRGIPVYTVLGQSLSRMIEFNDTDGDGLLNFYDVNETGAIVHVDTPVKALSLATSWTLSPVSTEVSGGTTYVNFTLSASNVPYRVVWDPFPRPAMPSDGVLDSIAFAFHLRVDVVTRSASVPFYKVTVGSSSERTINHVEFLGYRDVGGDAVEMGAKYDHLIDGWDFASPSDKLALETHLVFGNYFPSPVAQFVHHTYFRDHADDGNGTYHQDENTTATRPQLYTRDRIYLDDDWSRVGRFEWTSNVTVDGVDATMLFQVQGGGRLFLLHGGNAFAGFWILGAFVYPNGRSIVHDPAVAAESFLPTLPTSVNLTPLTILAVQLAVVAIAMGPALYLRAKARRQS